jgi:hypothetical protein
MKRSKKHYAFGRIDLHSAKMNRPKKFFGFQLPSKLVERGTNAEKYGRG